MKVHTFGTATSIKLVIPGSCFLFRLRDLSYIGIKIADAPPGEARFVQCYGRTIHLIIPFLSD